MLCRSFATVKQFSAWKLALYLLLSLLLGVVIAVVTTDMKHSCVESDSRPTEVCFGGTGDFTGDEELARALSKEGVERDTGGGEEGGIDRALGRGGGGYEGDGLLVITASSTSFMVRLRNLVGSIHFWEPEVHTVVYDIGFSAEDLEEIAKW